MNLSYLAVPLGAFCANRVSANPQGLRRGRSFGSFRQVRCSRCDSAENRLRRIADFDGDALQVLGGTLFDRPERLIEGAPSVLPVLFVDRFETVAHAFALDRRCEERFKRPLSNLK